MHPLAEKVIAREQRGTARACRLADDRAAVIPPLDLQFPGYLANVSDHLPVVLSIPEP